MSPQKLLLMLIMNILKNEQSSDIIYKRVFFSWVEVHHILVLPVETYRVFQLKQVLFLRCGARGNWWLCWLHVVHIIQI